MTWMNKWGGGFPLYLDQAHGNRISDVDGHEYVDFALGDTGAMAGHSPSRPSRRSRGEWPTRAGSRRCCPPKTPSGWAPS